MNCATKDIYQRLGSLIIGLQQPHRRNRDSLTWIVVRLLSSDNVSTDILNIVKHSSWDVDILLQIRYQSELCLSLMPLILTLQAGKNHLGVETGLTQHLEVQLN